jgi:hypothetical protein
VAEVRKIRLPVLAVLLLLPAASFAKEANCVLPVPDGSDTAPSQASLQGVVQSIKGYELTLRSKGGRDYILMLSPDSELHTVYGGGIEAIDLKAGQHALVWLEHCASPGKSSRIAVLQLCSLAAEPCPR